VIAKKSISVKNPANGQFAHFESGQKMAKKSNKVIAKKWFLPLKLIKTIAI